MKARFPFPAYPRGWFGVARSSDLPAEVVLPLSYLGRELVAFRTAAGEAHVLDAFCPHLGAHLGHGGAVRGESIECPFHAWRFDGSGRCVGSLTRATCRRARRSGAIPCASATA